MGFEPNFFLANGGADVARDVEIEALLGNALHTHALGVRQSSADAYCAQLADNASAWRRTVCTAAS